MSTEPVVETPVVDTPSEEVKGADSTAVFTPVVKLEDLDDSDIANQVEPVYTHRALLYRFVKPKDGNASKWIVRGKGDVKIIQNKSTKKCHMVMNMERTFRTCLNCLILPTVELKLNTGSDRTWVFNTVDYADFDQPGVAMSETFAIKFKTTEIAETFKENWDKYKKFNVVVDGEEAEAPPAIVDAVVTEKKEEEPKVEAKKEEEPKKEAEEGAEK